LHIVHSMRKDTVMQLPALITVNDGTWCWVIEEVFLSPYVAFIRLRLRVGQLRLYHG
jgi:hypothetical protein